MYEKVVSCCCIFGLWVDGTDAGLRHQRGHLLWLIPDCLSPLSPSASRCCLQRIPLKRARFFFPPYKQQSARLCVNGATLFFFSLFNGFNCSQDKEDDKNGVGEWGGGESKSRECTRFLIMYVFFF